MAAETGGSFVPPWLERGGNERRCLVGWWRPSGVLLNWLHQDELEVLKTENQLLRVESEDARHKTLVAENAALERELADTKAQRDAALQKVELLGETVAGLTALSLSVSETDT